ncbi:hypothetical protein V2J09_007265 [Rumex salicifolius]
MRSNAMKYEEDERRGNGAKVCIAIVLVLLVAFLIASVVILRAFKDSDSPTFKVQRVVIPTFKVDKNFTDDRGVLSVNLNVFLETENLNKGVTTEVQNMIMLVRWDQYGASLGETHVDTVKQQPNTNNTVEIDAHGASIITNKTVAVEEMKLHITFSGDVVFIYGPFHTSTYPFRVGCHNITASTRNHVCGSMIYSEKTMAYPESIAPTMSASETPPSTRNSTDTRVQLFINDDTVVLDNGILAVTITKPQGYVIGIEYNGVANILDEANPEDDRGYWDVVWAPEGAKGLKGKFDRIKCTAFRVITDREDHIEISFLLTYNPAAPTAKKVVPLDIDVRYIMLRGESGIYTYNILNRRNWVGCNILNARFAFKLHRTKYEVFLRLFFVCCQCHFHQARILKFMAYIICCGICKPYLVELTFLFSYVPLYRFRNLTVSDDKQRKMPLPEDRMKGRGQELAYPEAVKLINPIDAEFKGEVDDKYQYSDESHNIRVHGWRSNDPPMGFWQITPSYEFRTGGPNKQFLTSHVGPSLLAMFVSAHYSGENAIPKFKDGEPWSKVLGPVFMYANKIDRGQNPNLLWVDAKKKMLQQSDAWPYDFVASEDFPKANQRANVSGRFFVRDIFTNVKNIPANGSFVGLAAPGDAGSWQTECKGYQFWTRTASDGSFTIENVHAGNYNLFGWVRGFIGDYKYKLTINIKIGHNIDLGDIVYEPPRDGPTLWEIGEPDRTAREFFIPDPDPNYVNKLYVNHPDKFRQYGLWEKYSELYPTLDLIYTVNSSDYSKDWFYAQVTRKVDKGDYKGTTWQIKFNLDKVDQVGIYKLRLAIAGSSNAQVRVNEPTTSPPIFVVDNTGTDSAITRHGIHGLYWLFNVDVQGSLLETGENTIYLTQTKSSSPFQGIMYDYIRLEAPSRVAPK